MAQQPLKPTAVATQDTLEEPKKVIVDRSDLAEMVMEEDVEHRYLKGNVELRQGDVFMYCDTAVLIENNVIAVGNVIIQQSDSLNIFADSLYYEGDAQIADLFGDVRLDNKGRKIFTNHLNYNLKTKIANYYSRSLLTNDTTFLESNRGTYFVNLDEAQFRDSVVVIDTSFVLRSDSLDFSTETGIITFIAPTLIAQDSAKIYCERGFYDTQENYAEFVQNAQYEKGDQKATAKIIVYDGSVNEVILKGDAKFVENDKVASADIIRYEEKTEVINLEGNAKYSDEEKNLEGKKIRYDSKNEVFETEGRSSIVDGSQILDADSVYYIGDIGIAKGNVIWTDTADQITIESNRIDYNKSTDFVKASGGRPLLISVVEEDTLYMRADTLIALTENPDDTTRVLYGYHHVSIYKSNLQAVCDSLEYRMSDSLFSFYQDPIVWSDTSQFYADTIHMQMADNEIDKIYLKNEAYIINSPDEIYFNQIKGKNMTAYFRDEEIDKMRVVGNAESVYYILNEEQEYTGVNKCVCSSMLINFGNNEILDIMFYREPTSTLYPMLKADHDALKLPGFSWDMRYRPMSKDDLDKIVARKHRSQIVRTNPVVKDSTVVDSLNLDGKSDLSLKEKTTKPVDKKEKIKPTKKELEAGRKEE